MAFVSSVFRKLHLIAKRTFLALGVFLTAALVGHSPLPVPAQARANSSTNPVFENDIAPIFKANCLRCHSAAMKMGGLDLSTANAVLAGASKGPVVVPGKPGESPLYGMVKAGIMPLDRKTQLSPAEIETVRTWIAGLGSAGTPASRLASLGATTARAAHPAVRYRGVVDQYCVACHDTQVHTANLDLSKAAIGAVGNNGAIWEKVLAKLEARTMPPEGMPRPDESTYRSFSEYLMTELDQAAEKHPRPGNLAAHRLNRAEYGNVVRDLLAVDVDVSALLPADDSGYGFDNIADVLSVSPMLLQRYMAVAGKISKIAIGEPSVRPTLDTYDIPLLLVQDERMGEDLPFGSRGGAAIRHYFPLEGDYVIRIRLRRSGDHHDERIIGLGEPHQVEILLDGKRVQTFTLGGNGGVQASDDWPAPKTVAAKETARNRYEDTTDSILEARIRAKAGPHAVGVDFLDDRIAPEGSLQPRLAAFYFLDKRAADITPAVERITIDGPYGHPQLNETPSRSRIFGCRPSSQEDETSCAERILTTLARRAYRRPVTQADVQPLLALYKSERNAGNFEAGIRTGLKAILVSPEFLFRIERDPANVAPGSVYRISDIELASRLSFFLWSSMPDDRLLGLAAAGRLKDPAVLEREVQRMLADRRSKALIANFGGQWLYLRNIEHVRPDPFEYPEFDDSLRADFEQETELFLESNIREDHSVLDLLTADYTFVNERLARFYGIPNVYGSHFRRVSLAGTERRGLLGEASILTVTSYANRTSPTVRGRWIMDNILGAPPPPPPANVPSLKENTENGKLLSMRERMEQHRANPACAVCHVRMDPIGFSLENFDGIGKWRHKGDDGKDIDVSAVLPDGTRFRGPEGLRTVLLTQPQAFAAAITEKLLIYALGRGLEYYDAPAVRKITRDTAPGRYRWSSLILGIVNSTPFQMREARTP